MIGYGAVFRLDLFTGKWWYTNMLTNSNIQVSHTFTIIGLIAESTLKFISDTRSKIFGNLILKIKVVAKSSLILKHYLQLAECFLMTEDWRNTWTEETNTSKKKQKRIKSYVKARTFKIERITIFIFLFCIGLVTQLNGPALLKHHYITKRICEFLIGNSRFLIYNLLNQLLYYTV